METEDSMFYSKSWLFLPFGILAVARISISILLSLIYVWKTHIKIRLKPRENLQNKFGQWAVVTGCTSGIGEHFVDELASLGMNIILISRSLDKLKKQAVETEKKYGVKVKVIAVNYLSRDVYKIVNNEIQGFDIGLVVNNVGLNTDTGSRQFHEMSVQEIRDMVIVNTGACTLMTKVFLPYMIAVNKGYILNIGSTSGFLAVPHQALYSATKSYMRIWSKALDKEFNTVNISVRCSIPQFIRTGMCKGNDLIYNLPLFTCDPRVYTSAAILKVNTPDTAGYMMFDFILWFGEAIKAVLHRDVVTYIIYYATKPFVLYGSIVQE